VPSPVSASPTIAKLPDICTAESTEAKRKRPFSSTIAMYSSVTACRSLVTVPNQCPPARASVGGGGGGGGFGAGESPEPPPPQPARASTRQVVIERLCMFIVVTPQYAGGPRSVLGPATAHCAPGAGAA